MILTPEIDQFIEGILSSWNSPGGVSVAVVKQHDKDGTWHVETKGYGVAQVKGGKKMDEDSLVCIASNSKIFTTVAAGLLISDESLSPRISWDTKIADILPKGVWKLADPIASSETTIVDAMSHRTGLPRHDLMYTRTDTTESIVNLIHPVLNSQMLRFITATKTPSSQALSSIPLHMAV
uniref:Beta-lactamase-related domain-containing protein n=1 Tax=Moniliophthora roreri TaxID=221103 RepID=A0A0W0FYU3_MONRR